MDDKLQKNYFLSLMSEPFGSRVFVKESKVRGSSDDSEACVGFKLHTKLDIQV